MKKIFSTITLALALIGSAFAQTSYNSSRFSADFNGSVNINYLGTNPAGTGSTMEYESNTNGVMEVVAVRSIVNGKVIPVTQEAAQFYANQDATGAGNTVVSRTSKDVNGNDQTTYQGHPFAYICVSYVEGGVIFYKRTRYIIVDEHTTFFVVMISTKEKSDLDEWTRFEYSLNIK
jgi:hypothetical protein